MQRTETKQGFTLIELLIVIAIIGLLATLAIVSLTTAQQKARDAKRVADIKQLQNAVELYFSENPGGYPTVDPDNTTQVAWTDFTALIDEYMTQIPVPPDPTTESYTYYWDNGSDDGHDADAYYLSAVLEDTGNSALNGSVDGDQAMSNSPAAGSISSLADADPAEDVAPANTAKCDKTVGEYCVGS